MAGRTLPTSFTAGRQLSVEGVAYAKGATIPKAAVARLHNVDAYLSRRWIIPAPEVHGGRLRNLVRVAIGRPTHLNHAEKRSLLAP